MYDTYDGEEFWTEVIRRTGSNSAVEGWQSLKDLILSGNVSTSSLYGMHAALRSLSQQCQDQIAERRDKLRRATDYLTEGT